MSSEAASTEPARHQVGDLFVREAEDLLADILVVLAQELIRPQRAGNSSRARCALLKTDWLGLRKEKGHQGWPTIIEGLDGAGEGTRTRGPLLGKHLVLGGYFELFGGDKAPVVPVLCLPPAWVFAECASRTAAPPI